MSDLADTIDLSLLLRRAAEKAGITATEARRFLDEIAALPNEAGHRMLIEREREMLRRAAAWAAKECEQQRHRAKGRRS